MRKFLLLSGLVLAGLFAVPPQQAKADGFGLSFGINIAPGYYGYGTYGRGYYGRGYDYCPPSYYYRPYYRAYDRPYYYRYDYPRYRSYYGGPSFRFRYYDNDRYYRGYRNYDRRDYYRRHH